MNDELKPFMKVFRAGDVDGVEQCLQDGVNLSGATFKGATTGNFDFSGVDFSNTEFEDCVLTRVNWAGADLSGAYFRGTTLIECDLSGANLEGAAFDGCVLKRVIAAGATWMETELTGVEIDSCTISDADLSGAAWESVTVNNGGLSNVSGGAELTGVTIRSTELDRFDTTQMTLARCSSNAEPPPEGFRGLTGRRTRL